MDTENNKKNHLLALLAWGIASIFVLYMFLLQSSTSVMIPDLMYAFSIDTLGIGFLSSSYFYPYILLQMPAGLLIDYYKPRHVLTGAILLCATGTIIFALAPNLWIATLGRILMGVGSAPAVAGALYVACRRLPAARFALFAGLAESGGMLGGALGEIILAPSVTHIGWRMTLCVCAALAIVLSIATWLLLKERTTIKNICHPNQQSLLNNFKAILTVKQMWIVGLVAGLIFAPITAFGALWCVPYLQKLYHVKLVVAASASAMIFFGCAIGAPLLGYLSDKLCQRRIPIIVSTTIATLLSLIIIYFPPTSIIWMFVLIFFFGISLSTYILPFALTKDIVPTHVQGAAMGFTNMMCILLGAPILQPFIGGLLQFEDPAAVNVKEILFSIHDYHIAFAVIPIMLTLAVFTVLFVREK